MPASDLYRPAFVRALFDRMAKTYGVVNVVSSFGFCVWWRRQCVAGISIPKGAAVQDWLSGMGELWPGLARRIGPEGQITAVDFSPEMCRRAEPTRARLGAHRIHLLEADILENGLADASADVIVSSFGLKTFSPAQRAALAHEVARVLKPGGAFAFVEIAVPRARLLRRLYLFYLRRVIPVIGRLLLGDPSAYRMLGVYTEAFSDGADVPGLLQGAGLTVRAEPLFFGCAVRITGTKPGTTTR